jgi:hypothetical protein
MKGKSAKTNRPGETRPISRRSELSALEILLALFRLDRGAAVAGGEHAGEVRRERFGRNHEVRQHVRGRRRGLPPGVFLAARVGSGKEAEGGDRDHEHKPDRKLRVGRAAGLVRVVGDHQGFLELVDHGILHRMIAMRMHPPTGNHSDGRHIRFAKIFLRKYASSSANRTWNSMERRRALALPEKSSISATNLRQAVVTFALRTIRGERIKRGIDQE